MPTRSPKALAALVAPIARGALGRKGTALGGLLADWPRIAGEALAARAVPEKLAFPRGRQDGAELLLRCAGADALELQHEAPRILQRINGHFGYAAVARIKLRQGPAFAGPAGAPRWRPAAAAPEAAAPMPESVAAALAGVEDTALRERLARLGRQLDGSRANATQPRPGPGPNGGPRPGPGPNGGLAGRGRGGHSSNI